MSSFIVNIIFGFIILHIVQSDKNSWISTKAYETKNSSSYAIPLFRKKLDEAIAENTTLELVYGEKEEGKKRSLKRNSTEMSTESSKGQDIYEQDLSSFDNTSTIVDKETLKKNNDEENSLSEEDNNVIPRKENFIEKKKRETENKNTEVNEKDEKVESKNSDTKDDPNTNINPRMSRASTNHKNRSSKTSSGPITNSLKKSN